MFLPQDKIHSWIHDCLEINNHDKRYYYLIIILVQILPIHLICILGLQFIICMYKLRYCKMAKIARTYFTNDSVLFNFINYRVQFSLTLKTELDNKTFLKINCFSIRRNKNLNFKYTE